MMQTHTDPSPNTLIFGSNLPKDFSSSHHVKKRRKYPFCGSPTRGGRRGKADGGGVIGTAKMDVLGPICLQLVKFSDHGWTAMVWDRFGTLTARREKMMARRRGEREWWDDDGGTARRESPPALILLQMNEAVLEADCYLDTALVTVTRSWRVHCVMGSCHCDIRVAVPMGEQVKLMNFFNWF
ncbi:hypothetical protein Vadar_030548 [Vaccinium darrowii]|uniref:Uncharacterized protein n=1 Tax=Vaccinium darrowii TaxID=229202 RepID=A0ACB7YRV8_9ERIC|nr:hypothetical protein Vadar_030548 [Vaccinium darrowii]